jgi:mannosyltransferase OCH1-like enzyme
MIPKILHQIWIGPKPAPTNLMKTWKEKHPDFEYILWTEQEIEKRRLQLTCIDKINMIPEINGKADIVRWEILYEYGGYFVDADSICIEPFDYYFSGKSAFATFENENVRAGLIATGTMGFIPKHPLCLDIIQWINSNESTQLIKETRAWYSVGPGLLTKMLDTGKYKDVSIYPSHCFLPIHFTGPVYEGHKKVYGYQEWGTAKQSYDTMNSVVLPKELLEPITWVSVIITSYNTMPLYMKECLDSIKCQNGHFGIELVWINDGSNEDNTIQLEQLLFTFKLSTRFTRVIYRRNETNMGTAKSSNLGLELCTNDIVFKMDSDDIMFPNRMSIQLEFMNKNPNAVICGANIRMFKLDGDCRVLVNDTRHPNIITWIDIYNNKSSWCMNNPTLCYRKSAIASVGNYRTNDDRILYIHEDYDLLARLLKKYQMAYNLPDVLVLYRLHANQLTHNLDIQRHLALRNDILENALITVA